MAGPYLCYIVEIRLAVKGAWGATVGWPWSGLVPGNSPVAGRDTLPFWQGFRVRTEQGMVVFEPPPLPATVGVGPGIGT